MCLGPELLAAASLAATGAGSYANSRAQRAVAEQQNRVAQADRERQRQLQEESDARVRQTLDEFTPAKQQQEVQQATAARTAAYAPTSAPMPQATPTTATAPRSVRDDSDRQVAAAKTRSMVSGGQRAALGALGDTSLGQQFKLARAGEDIGRVRGFQRGNSAVLPYEMQDAQGAGRKYRTAANVFSTLGKIGQAFALGGAGAGGSIGYGTIDPTMAGEGLPY